jgi:hypothetical protein
MHFPLWKDSCGNFMSYIGSHIFSYCRSLTRPPAKSPHVGSAINTRLKRSGGDSYHTTSGQSELSGWQSIAPSVSQPVFVIPSAGEL